MSLIEKSEIFRAKQGCKSADSVTITTIFPTFKKEYGIFQKSISRYRGIETVLAFVLRGAEDRSQLIIKAERMNWDKFSLESDFRCTR